MLLILGLLLLAALAYWAGFRARLHPAQHLSKGAFFINLVLAAFVGYFAWREFRSRDELADLIQPVPEIVEVSYVPTSGEVQALAGFLAAVPEVNVHGGRSGGRSGGRTLVRRAPERMQEYWLVTTELPRDSVIVHYRAAAPRDGWSVRYDRAPWLFLTRTDGTLLIFVSSRSPRYGSRVVHVFSPEPPSAVPERTRDDERDTRPPAERNQP